MIKYFKEGEYKKVKKKKKIIREIKRKLWEGLGRVSECVRFVKDRVCGF